MFYKNYFHEIYVISPTINSDDKWDYIKKQPLIIENKPLKRWMAEEKRKRDGAFKGEIVAKPPVSLEGVEGQKNTNEKDYFDGLIPEENFISEDYNPADFMKIIQNKKAIVTALKRHGKPKYLADRTLFIFDDQVGSPMFRGSNGNEFKAFCTKHRYFFISYFLIL